MKKQIIGSITVLFFFMIFFGCMPIVGTPIVDVDSPDVPPIEEDVPLPPPVVILPLFVENAINNAPEDVLVGVGTSTGLASLSQSRGVATISARAEITRQVNTMALKMVQDFETSNGVDHATALSFMENITVALTKTPLSESYIVEEDSDPYSTIWKPEYMLWAVIYMDKEDVKTKINDIVSEAKLAVPEMDSFDIEGSFDEIFAWVKAQE